MIVFISNTLPSFASSLIIEYSIPLITVIMNSGILPLVVYYLSLYEKHYKRSYREKSILIKSFIFLLINSILIPSFKNDELVNMLNKLKEFNFEKKNYNLTAPLLDNSYFFCRYIIQVTFLSNTIQLLAVPPFLMRKIRVLIARSDYEKIYASMVKKYFDYGFHYSFALIVFLMTLIFSTTIPLVVPFGCLFFYVKYYFDKYNLLFFYPAEFESQGNLGKVVIKFMLFAIFFFQIILSGLFYFLKEVDEESKNWISIFYIVIAVILYFVSKRILIIELDSSSNKFFDLLLSKIKKESSSDLSLERLSSQSTNNELFLKKDERKLKKVKFIEMESFNKIQYNNGIVKNTQVKADVKFLKQMLVSNKNYNVNNNHYELTKKRSSTTGESDINEKYETNLKFDLNKNEEETNSRFIKILHEAYIHPTQKKLLDNPIFVYNDSFRYLKNVVEENERETILNHTKDNKINNEISDYSSIIKKLKRKEKNKIIDDAEERGSQLLEEMLEI